MRAAHAMHAAAPLGHVSSERGQRVLARHASAPPGTGREALVQSEGSQRPKAVGDGASRDVGVGCEQLEAVRHAWMDVELRFHLRL